MEYDLIIIGGGAGGLSVAAGAAQLGVKTLLIDRGPLGGDCLWHGCVPSKALIHVANTAHQMAHADRLGLQSLRPEVDMKSIREHIHSVQNTIEPHDNEQRFRKLGCDVVFGSAAFVDEHEIKVDPNPDMRGRQQPEFLRNEVLFFTAKKIVIATGSRPFVVPFPGLAKFGYLTNEDIFQLETLPESLLVVGSGPIAMEMAQALQRLGTDVTVLLREDRILSKEDDDMVDMLMEGMEEEGIEFLKHAQLEEVTEVRDGKKYCKIRYEDHMDTRSFTELFIATGRIPNLELNLEAAKIAYTKKGITVDSRLRTSQKHIYAIGDVNGQSAFTHGAAHEASVVISNAIFHWPTKVKRDHIPWCTYVDPELASCGKNEKMCQAEGIEYDCWTASYETQDRAVTQGKTIGKCKILTKRGTATLLGVQVLGPHAGEVIAEASLALQQGLSIKALATSIHAYPTLSEIVKQAAGTYFTPRLFSTRTRWWLKKLFGYRG